MSPERFLSIRWRRPAAVVCAFLTVSVATYFIPPAPPAAALDPGGAGIPNAYVVTGGAGGLLGGGLLVVGPGVVTSSVPAAIGVAGGSTVAGMGIAAGATGFALGWLGMTAACGSAVSSGLIDAASRLVTAPIYGNETGTVCNPYEFQDDLLPTPELTDSGWLTSSGVSNRDYSFSSLPDFAQGSLRFGAIIRNADGGYPSIPVTSSGVWGCVTAGVPNADGQRSFTNQTSGCRTSNNNNAAASAPPYVGTWFRLKMFEAVDPGNRNGIVRPGDTLRVYPVRGSGDFHLDVDDPMYAAVPLAPEVNERGLEMRYRTRAYCETTNGTEVVRTTAGAWAFENEQPEIPPHGCLTTELPRVIQTLLDIPNRINTGFTTEIQREYTIDPQTTPELEECFRMGRAVPCELTTTTAVEDPDTITGCFFGGNPAPLAWCAPAPVEPAFDPVVGTGTDPGPTPTTTPPTTTPSPPTTQPPDTGIPPAEPPPPPPPPAEGDNQWATCMEDQLDSDWGEVTFNPVTWVRAIIYYVTAPIICAIWWLVVPPGGFASLLDDFQAVAGDSALMGVWTALTQSFTWTGGCAPVDFGDPLGGAGPSLGTIDVGMCGNLVIAFVWTVVLALAVLSMAGNLVRTLWTFGQYQKVGLV